MARITNVIFYLETFGPLLVSIVLIFGAAMDILYDIQQAASVTHIVAETTVFFVGFLVNLYFVDRAGLSLEGLRRENQKIHQTLEVSHVENQKLKLEQQKFREEIGRAHV